MDGGTGNPEVLKVMMLYSISSISSSFLAALVKIVAGFFGEGWYADVECLHLEGDDMLVRGSAESRDVEAVAGSKHL